MLNPLRPFTTAATRLALPLALVAASGCNDHGGNINAIADLRVEVPDSIATDLEYPVLVTLSIGYEGREERTTTNAEQTVLVFCHAPDEPFVYRDSVQLRTACKREDFYVRATLRSVELSDENACDDADADGVLFLDDSEMDPGNRIIAETRMVAWTEKECGDQYESFDLVVEELD